MLVFLLPLLITNFSVVHGQGSGEIAADGLLAPATVRIDPPASTVLEGTAFSTDVMIDDAVNLGSFQFDLVYDPSVVQVTAVTLGTFLGSTGRSTGVVGPTIDNTAGKVTFGAFSFGSQTGPSGTGTLATITFSTAGIGTSPLDLQNSQVTDTLGNSQSPVTEQDGTVTVSSQATSATPTATPTATSTPLATPTSTATPTTLTNEVVLRISPPTQTVALGQPLVAEVVIDKAVNLGSLEFDLLYQPSVILVKSVTLGPFLGSTGRSTGVLGPTIDNTAGKMTFGAFSFGSQPGPSGTGTLATITFSAIGAGSSPLDLQNSQVTDTQGNPQNLLAEDDGTVWVGGQLSLLAYFPYVVR